MPFSLPVFNLVADFWTGGHTPAADPPDTVGVPCQLYLTSRPSTDQVASTPTLYTLPIIIRMPLGIYTPAKGDITEVAPGSADYYLVRWVQVIHLGFPNAYLTALVEQCDAAGGTPRP